MAVKKSRSRADDFEDLVDSAPAGVYIPQEACSTDTDNISQSSIPKQIDH